ncbi:DUF1472 domain-containing protein (plasmid) [Enterobacteriaceae bacterium Kacie_13]|nr:DUF1472 domain-containing protein [Enterobacteriaceae bacterium Kacie_13]
MRRLTPCLHCRRAAAAARVRFAASSPVRTHTLGGLPVACSFNFHSPAVQPASFLRLRCGLR